MARGSIATFLGVAVASSVLVGSLRAQATAPGTDPIIGTWRLNVARSTYSPGPPPASSQYDVRHFSTLEGGWMRFIQTSVNAQGEPTFQIGVFRIDGQRYPVQNVNTLTTLLTTDRPTNVMRSYRRVDARSTEWTIYTDGVAGLPSVRTVAPDGMSYTETTRGTNAQGLAVNNVIVLDRVR